VERLQLDTGVFHDRSYNFDSLGHFTGKTFVKYSNDDKITPRNKVMMKLRTHEPATVFIVKLDQHNLEWLDSQGYTPSDLPGVSFSGSRSTAHKDWDTSLLTMDHFAATAVWSKTFPAGTISIPGNGGGDGSFLIFLDWASADDDYDSRLTAYWEAGGCGVHGNDFNWDWCGFQSGVCPVTKETDLCPSGVAELAAFHGTGFADSYSRDGCNYFYLAQYRCTRVIPEIEGEAEFVGCFVDDAARDMGTMVGTTQDSSTNTFALCRARCGNSRYMSLQFGGECFCSNSYGTGPQYVQVDESQCNVNQEPCSSHSHNCGGEWRQAIYEINNIAHWDMAAHQDMSGGFFDQSARQFFLYNENDNTDTKFMNVGNLNRQDYLVDGKFHFRLVYTDVIQAHAACNVDGPPSGTQEAEWTQTSWLTENTVTGFEVISPSNLAEGNGESGCAFAGLAPSSSSNSVLDGSHDHTWWFASVGATTAWEGGIPSLFGGVAQSVTLYVQRA